MMETIDLNIELAKYVGKHTAQSIAERIKSVKAKSDDERTINELSDIINELIQEKSELLNLAQAYDEQLQMRKISEEDVDYITGSIIPIIKKIMDKSQDHTSDEINELIEIVKPILSKDTFNILQMLGFNFKKAIGDPLTQLVSESILQNSFKEEEEINLINKQIELEVIKLVQDEQSLNRYINLTSNS